MRMSSLAIIAALGGISGALAQSAPSSYYLPLGKRHTKPKKFAKMNPTQFAAKAKPKSHKTRNKKGRP